jgi:zinc transport system substrate-binding protein
MSALKASRHLRNSSWLLVSLTAIGLGGCGINRSPNNSEVYPMPLSNSPNASKLRVVTTFIPITDFTKAVAGDRAVVNQLLPSGVGPHDYQAKPEDVQTLVKAQVLVKNGLGMEEFLEGLVKNAGNPKLKIIDSSQGIKTVTNDLRADQHEHGSNQEHDHGEFNPHIYLDPKRAIEQINNIRDGLIAVDPAGKASYTANAAAYELKLKALDAEISKTLKPFAGKTFVTYHDFAPYFAQSYNLKADYLVGIPEENASPEDVKRVSNAVKKSNLKTLLTESASDRSFSALAKDINVQVSVFDPLERRDATAAEDYLSTMRRNLKNLETAFIEKNPQLK